MAKRMTGKELVAFCRSKIGTPYVYGMKGKVMTEQNYKFLKNTYGKMVWLSDRDKIGRVCVDCSGLISWACGVTLGSGQWKARATKINPISTIEKAPIGALVWMQGHIGVYTGMKELQEFLKSKLNADDYFTAEEMLNDLIAETEEKGFAAGAKYTAGLGKELFAE